MGDADYLFQTYGDVDFPSTSADVSNGQLFSAFDPARDRLLDFFKTAINHELAGAQTDVDVLTTSAWDAARAGTVFAAKVPVEDTINEQPRKSVLRSGGYGFPLLGLYRTESEHDWRTLSLKQQKCTWMLDYILGPLKDEDYRKMGGALSAVEKLLGLLIEKRGHPAFDSAALQFFADKGGLASIELVKSEQGLAEFGGDGEGLEFYALRCELHTVEIDGWAEGFDGDFEGFTVNVKSGGGEGLMPDLVIGRTEYPPP